MAQASDLVVAIFDRRDLAERAVAELHQVGLALDEMEVLTRESEGERAKEAAHLSADAADGAALGAVAGAGTGAVAGALASLLIPGLGTVLGGGLLLGILGGAALGAAGGTFLGPFLALDMGEDEAHYYARHLEEGRTVVVVKSQLRQQQVHDILRRHGGRDYTTTLEKAHRA
jgi:hypothetical protein